MTAGVVITTAEPDERMAALRLTFSHLDPETRLARVSGGLELIDRGELDPAGILVARVNDRVIGAVVAAPVPGAGAAIWPSQVERGIEPAVADALAARAADWLRGQGVKLAQALLAPEDMPLAGPLLRAGFRRATALWYLRHDLGGLPPVIHGGLNYSTFAITGPAAFTAMLARTYEDTQDCPEISNARTAPEALAGHMAGGFDPNYWWLASAGGEAVGLLLVNPAVDGGGWEIAYVGVASEHRRRGYGRELVRKALLEAKAAGQPNVSLAVDARNAPALAMYRRLGFESHESREVLLAVWA